MPTTKRPKMNREYGVVYDWLAANGINEWIPEDPRILVDLNARTITYTAFKWDGSRGFSPNIVVRGGQAVVEDRTVPLKVEPDDFVRLRIEHMNRRASQP